MASRYLPNVLVTLQLAALSTRRQPRLRVPFAYVLVRKIRYRDLVRALMVFPMFGALYIAFGMRFILLPGGPATPLLEALGIPSTSVLYSLPSVVFAMSDLHVPVHGHEHRRGPQQRRPDPRGGGRLPRRAAVADVPADPAAADPGRDVIAGILMVFGWNIGTFAEPLLLGSLERAARPRLDALPARRRPDRLRPVDARWASSCSSSPSSSRYFSLRYSRGALVE